MQPDRAELLDFLHGLYRLQTVGSLSEFICRQLPDLIGGENAIVCGHDGGHRVITSVVAKHPFSCANLMPHINESGMMAQHPLWENTFDSDQPVRSVSDTTSRRDWHRNPLYGEVFAPDGIEDQLNVEVLGTPERFTTINVLRSRRGFSAEERAIMTELRPHFAQALMNAALAEEAGLIRPPSDHCWMVPVDPHGRIVAEGEMSAPMIARRFGRNGRLPEDVERWIAEQARHLNQGWLETQIAPYQLEHKGELWQFTLHRDFAQAHYRLSVKRLGGRLCPERISPRECEILQWVSEGKSNDEIACILGVSVNTVKTHLKRCFAKLGVENRTAAAGAWRQWK